MVPAHPSSARARRPGRRRLAALTVVTMLAAAVASTVGVPGAGAAEQTFAYHCDGQPTAIRFPDVSVPLVTGGMTTALMTTSFQLALPPVPPGSTISLVTLDIPGPQAATSPAIGVLTGRNVFASGGGLTLTSTTSDADGTVHLTFGGTQPAGTAVPVAVSIGTQLQAHPTLPTRGTLTFPLPAVTVTTDQRTVSCAPDPGQVLGATNVGFTGIPPTTTSTTIATTTTTTKPPTTHPLCAYRTIIPARFWRVLVDLFDVRC